MSKDIKKILVLRFSSLGDILMTTAMLRCLRKRFPLAKIDFAVRDDFKGLLENNPHIDRLWTIRRGSGFTGLWQIGRSLSLENYDLIYDAHRSLRSRFLMSTVGAKLKITYPKHYLARSLALTFKFPRLTNRTRMLERFIEPLLPLGVAYDGLGAEFVVSEAQKRSAMLSLPEGVTTAEAEKFIGIVPCAQWEGKRWPLDRFRKLTERLMSVSPQRILVFGGKSDNFCAELVRKLSADRVINLQGRTTLGESAYWLSRCTVVACNDTGLMHLADSLNIPTVVIFGPTSGELGCLPFHPQAISMEPQLWCRPCSKNGEAPCIRGRRICLESTPVDAVFDAVRLTAQSEAKA